MTDFETITLCLIYLTGCIAVFWYLGWFRKKHYEYVPTTHSPLWVFMYYFYLIRIVLRWIFVKCWLLDPLDVRMTSRLVEGHTTRYLGLRTTLIDNLHRLFVVPMSNAHTHKNAAQLRTSANMHLNDAVRKAGYTPYNVSRANHDIDYGSRYFYHLKDIATPFRDDVVHDNTALVFCDVDYYCDIPRWMKLFKPMLLYTLVPEVATYRGPDYAFRLIDNTVEYQVSGGAAYTHPLWDYTGDMLSVVDDNGDLCVFNLEQKKMPGDPNRRLVWLVPCARITGPFWRHCFTCVPLQRKTYTHRLNDVCVNMIYESISDRLSIARNGDWHSVELAGRTYDAIRKRIRNKQTPPVIADVERILREAGNEATATTDAPLLFQLIVDGQLKPNVVKTTTLQSHFQPVGPLATEDGRTSGVVSGNPLVSNPGVFPMKGYNADAATIGGRIHGVLNNVMPGKKYKIWANSFVEALITNPGKGTPFSVEQVRRLQTRATQQARYAQVKDNLSSRVINKLKAFIKTEAYAASNDPRNITTMSTELTVVLSCFTYAMKETLKIFDWYGPGKTPKQSALRLGVLARKTEKLIATDFSRMDGTVSEFLVKHVVFPVYMRWCAITHRPELKHLLNQVYKQTGTTAEGLKFKPGYGTRSGSPITTDCNEIVTAYIDYCAHRKAGLEHVEAMASLGLIFSDDAVQCMSVEGFDGLFEETATELGMKLKSVVVSRGDPVPYLGRYFVDPAVRTDSFQDPMRTLCKLHLTTNKNVSTNQALINKASGYLTTDRLTPLIGTWCRKVHSELGCTVKNLTSEEQYKCSNAWPQKDSVAIRDAMAKILGVEVQELVEFDGMLSSATLDQVPALLDNPASHRIAAVVGDNIVGPVTHIKHDNHPQSQSNGAGASMSEATRDKPQGDHSVTVGPAVAPQGLESETTSVRNVRKPPRRGKNTTTHRGHRGSAGDATGRIAGNDTRPGNAPPDRQTGRGGRWASRRSHGANPTSLPGTHQVDSRVRAGSE